MIKQIKIPFLFFTLLIVCQSAYSQKQHFNKDSIVNVLENVFKTDTELRLQLDTLLTKVEYNSPEALRMYTQISKSDSLNVDIVTKILDRFGWLSPDETSKNANDALFLVIQHAGLKTQLNYIPMLTQAVKNKKALPKQLALLVDRTNMAQGKFQIYGSQLKGPKIGALSFFPIADEPNVNKRRTAIGLEPLERYAERFEISYQLPLKDKYLGKIILDININDKLGSPLENVAIYLGNNKLIGRSDTYGRVLVILDKKYKEWAVILRKEGYGSMAFGIDGKNIEVFTGSYILNTL